MQFTQFHTKRNYLHYFEWSRNFPFFFFNFATYIEVRKTLHFEIKNAQWLKQTVYFSLLCCWKLLFLTGSYAPQPFGRVSVPLVLGSSFHLWLPRSCLHCIGPLEGNERVKYIGFFTTMAWLWYKTISHRFQWWEQIVCPHLSEAGSIVPTWQPLSHDDSRAAKEEQEVLGGQGAVFPMYYSVFKLSSGLHRITSLSCYFWRHWPVTKTSWWPWGKPFYSLVQYHPPVWPNSLSSLPSYSCGVIFNLAGPDFSL